VIREMFDFMVNVDTISKKPVFGDEFFRGVWIHLKDIIDDLSLITSNIMEKEENEKKETGYPDAVTSGQP